MVKIKDQTRRPSNKQIYYRKLVLQKIRKNREKPLSPITNIFVITEFGKTLKSVKTRKNGKLRNNGKIVNFQKTVKTGKSGKTENREKSKNRLIRKFPENPEKRLKPGITGYYGI